MRICHAATFWPNRYGHTHYTDGLIAGMRQHLPEQHSIAAEHGSDPLDGEAIRCVPCFRRDQDYVEAVCSTVRELRAEVVIFQYSEDLWGNDARLPRLLARLRQAGVATVVNSHSIYPVEKRIPYGTQAALDLALAREASCMMVHSRRMKRDLVARGVDPRRIAVIPHGSKALERRDPQESRRALGLPPHARVVLFFGFIWLGKGLDFLLDVFARVARRVPDAYLYVGGYTARRVVYTRIYMGYLRARMHWLGIAERTRQWGGYVPDEEVPTIYSAADVVAMPYRQDYSSVSGVVHQTAGIGKLMLCSRIAKFDEVLEHISPELVVDPEDTRGWVEGLVRLLTDGPYAARARERILSFAEQTSWPAVGRMHLDLCAGLLAGKAPAEALGQ